MSRRNRKQYGQRPTDVDGQLATRVEFYKSELTKTIKGIFELDMPNDWEIDYVLNQLIFKGYIAIAKTDVGAIPVKGTLFGYNFWNYPTNFTVSMPVLQSFDRTLGVDCEIIYLERTRLNNFYTFTRLLDVYAYKLAAVDAGIDVNIFNSRAAYIAEAESKGQAETIKALYDKITEGEPLVVYRTDALSSKVGLQVAFNNLKQNYIADVMQDSKRTIINEFLTCIGINNANTDKRERLVSNEVDANNIELACNTALWKDNLERCCERVTKLFGNIFNIKLRFDPCSAVEQMGGQNDSTGHDINVETE